MSRFDWLSEYLARLEDEHVLVRGGSFEPLAPAYRMLLDPEDWDTAGRVAAALGCRWAGLWGDPVGGYMVGADPAGQGVAVYTCLEHLGDYLVLATEVELDHPFLASHTPYYPGADRLERHLRDMLGISFLNSGDDRRWTRHQAWSEDQFPLRPDFPAAGHPSRHTPADTKYPFAAVQGSGVYEIPVGPVHAGIIEPGHFRFQAVGEEILRLEERLGYVHKGIEKIAVGRDARGLARLAGRITGDSTVAHTWAACQAMERAADWAVPPRANALRALAAERERVANHLGDIGAVCNDVAFAFANAQCSRLREDWARRSHELFGHRLLMDLVVPGGVARDLPDEAIARLRADHTALRRAVVPLFDIIDDFPSLEDRLQGTGRLRPEDARALGCTGYVGKASGQGFDVRHDSPYAPYDGLRLKVPVMTEGDVAARVRVRMEEVHDSLTLMDRLLDALPASPIPDPLGGPLPAPPLGSTGLGMVDGWRGEILSFVRFGEGGRISRFFPRDPSWLTWPALERLIQGNIVPDFPVCNKSVNASYSAHDL
jgi:Ni,Fe-hydrogenase III large subunit